MNRRRFLATAGLGSLALTHAEAFAAKAKPVGLQLYTLRDQINQLGVAKILETVAGLGYKKVENFSYNGGKIFKQTPAEYAKLLKDNGLAAPSGHYSLGSLRASSFQQTLDDAATMGQKYVVVAFLQPGERSPESVASLYDTFNQASETAQKSGLTLGYHNHDFEFTQKVDGEKIYDLLLKNTSIPMEMDLYWVLKAGESPEAYFKKYPGRFPLWHVKDMAKTEKREFAEVGTGSVDFAGLFKQAKTAGLKHYFVEQDVCQRPPLEAVKISIENIQKAKWG